MKINCLIQSAGNSGWSTFSCNKILPLIIFSANFNEPESTASISVFNDSSVVSPISVNSHMYDCKVIVKDIFANDET